MANMHRDIEQLRSKREKDKYERLYKLAHSETEKTIEVVIDAEEQDQDWSFQFLETTLIRA